MARVVRACVAHGAVLERRSARSTTLLRIVLRDVAQRCGRTRISPFHRGAVRHARTHFSRAVYGARAAR
eukprot:9842317-Lingulodinium_polyedra.AAC.1